MATSLAEAVKRAKGQDDAATRRRRLEAEQALRGIMEFAGFPDRADCVEVAPGEWLLFGALRVLHLPAVPGVNVFDVYRDPEGQGKPFGTVVNDLELKSLLASLDPKG